MERFRREQKLFGLELLYFFLLAFSRFFDHKLLEHPVPFSFMEHYGTAVGLTLIYLLFLFGVMGAALWLERKRGETGSVCEGAHSSASREREICWLSIFLSAFAVPFFLHRDYFGTSDELVLTFVLAALLLVLGKSGRGEQKAQSREAALEKTSLAITILIAGTFTAIATVLGFFVPDVRDLLSGRQFVVMLLLLSPYGYWGLRFFGGLLRGTRGRKRWTYVLCAVGGVCPAILWTAAGDYSRAVFYGFVGVILSALCLTALGDAFFVAHVWGMKEEIRKVLPIPAVFVLYPLIFITFWMMGWESIPAEEILKLQ